MKHVKILGTGCANCRNTLALVEAVAKECGVDISLEKVENLPDIMSYGVMSTPGVVIDGKVYMSATLVDECLAAGAIRNMLTGNMAAVQAIGEATVVFIDVAKRAEQVHATATVVPSDVTAE